MPDQTRNSDQKSLSDQNRLFLFGALFIALSATGAYVIYDRIAGRELSFDPRLFSWPIVAGSLFLLLIYFVSDGLRLYYTLNSLGYRIPFRRVFRLVFINILFSNITPLATGGGFAQIWYLRRYGIPLGKATAATTVRTLLAVMFIFSAAPILILSMERLKIPRLDDGWLLYLLLFISCYLVFFLVLIFKNRWFIIPLDGLLKQMRKAHLISDRRYRRWRFASKRELVRLSEGFLHYLAGSKSDVILSVLFTFVFLLSLFSFPAILLWGLGYDVGYLKIIGLLTITTFIMYFSPTPGASGIAEIAFGFFFAGVIGASHLVLVTVSWRVLTIYLGMIIGLIVVHHELFRDQNT